MYPSKSIPHLPCFHPVVYSLFQSRHHYRIPSSPFLLNITLDVSWLDTVTSCFFILASSFVFRSIDSVSCCFNSHSSFPLHMVVVFYSNASSSQFPIAVVFYSNTSLYPVPRWLSFTAMRHYPSSPRRLPFTAMCHHLSSHGDCSLTMCHHLRFPWRLYSPMHHFILFHRSYPSQ